MHTCNLKRVKFGWPLKVKFSMNVIKKLNYKITVYETTFTLISSLFQQCTCLPSLCNKLECFSLHQHRTHQFKTRPLTGFGAQTFWRAFPKVSVLWPNLFGPHSRNLSWLITFQADLPSLFCAIFFSMKLTHLSPVQSWFIHNYRLVYIHNDVSRIMH